MAPLLGGVGVYGTILYNCGMKITPHHLVTRHRENLLQAENSRIYHSQQIEQNRKISCSCSDFNNKITKKVSSAHKIKFN